MLLLSSALQSGAILLREGIEALLVIAALAAFLRKAREESGVRALYVGAASAVLASIVAAALFQIFLNGAHDDRVEALVMVAAAALMFYMSGWLFLRQDGRAWTAELKRTASRALDSGARWSLGAIAFLAVFREGAETVLFLHALGMSEGGWNLSHTLGLAGAALLLAGLFVALTKVALQLPLRPIFLVTSALLFVMGLRFVGGAIQELQEQALLPVHDANMLADMLLPIGFNATWEAVGTQLAIGLVAVLSLFALKAQRQAA